MKIYLVMQHLYDEVRLFEPVCLTQAGADAMIARMRHEGLPKESEDQPFECRELEVDGALVAERDLAQAMHSEASRQRDACAEELQATKDDLAAWRQEAETAEQERGAAEREIGRLREVNALYEKQRNEAEAKLAVTADVTAELKGQVEELRAEMSRLEARIKGPDYGPMM